MKKILFVVSTLNTGGAQKILSNIIMNLPKNYEATTVLNDTENIVYPYKGNIVSLGLKEQDNKKNIFYQLKVFGRRLSVLHQLKKTGEYAATISFLDSANFANIITGNKNSKVILTLHGFHRKGWANPKVETVANLLIRHSYKKADKIIAVSYGLKRELHEKFGVPENRINVIYNGYDVEEIQKKALVTFEKHFEKKDDDLWIVTSGRMELVKGQWHLIKAFSVISSKMPKAKLVIMGDGSLRTKLENMVQKYGVKDKVIFTGFLNNPFPILAKSDIFVLSSLSEGYPNAIAEAMICGLPCISVDCESGPREMLAENQSEFHMQGNMVMEKYGILCPAFKESDGSDNFGISKEESCLAKAIETMAMDVKLREHYRQMSREKTKEYDMKNIIRAWIEVIG